MKSPERIQGFPWVESIVFFIRMTGLPLGFYVPLLGGHGWGSSVSHVLQLSSCSLYSDALSAFV